MAKYEVAPYGEKLLFEHLGGIDDPVATALRKLGGKPAIYQGSSGVQIGDIHYSSPSDYLNVLRISKTSGTRETIETPVQTIEVDKDVVFIDKDTPSRVTVTSSGFSVDVGKKVNFNSKKQYTTHSTMSSSKTSRSPSEVKTVPSWRKF